MRIKYNLKEEERIDQYLFDYFSRSEEFKNKPYLKSRSQIQHLIRNGKVSEKNNVIKKSGHLLIGEGIIIIDILDVIKKPKLIKWDNWKIIDVLYENSDYIVINKPPNLPVHPGSGNWDNTLVNILVSRYDELANNNTSKPGIVHRIDKNTTGVLIIAKTNEMFTHLQNQFINREVKKYYLGLVKGHVKNLKAKIEVPLARSKSDRRKITAAKSGKEAITFYQVIERYKDFDFLKFNILTGRTHQIRVHSKYMNTPIFNDYLYGKREYSNPYIGHFLHAKSIEFKDLDGKTQKFEAELPLYFKKKIKELRGEIENGKN